MDEDVITIRFGPKFKLTVIIIAFCLLAGFLIYRNGVRRAVPNIPPPVQEECTGGTRIFLDGFEIRMFYLYKYDIEGLVVHTKAHPGLNIGDRLSPLDAAIAWGKVAEYNDRINFHWDQIDRFAKWNVNDIDELDPVGGLYAVNGSFSNNHLIPSNDTIRGQLLRLRRGDHVRIKGYLVECDGNNEDSTRFLEWKSSTSRDDEGDGACEIIYVTSIEWLA